MKVFAIVVTWRGGKWYDKCLGSLRDSDVPVETIVIDNASGDGSVDYIREHFPNVILMPQSENLGFAKANNIGIKYAYDNGADFVFLLNQDAWINSNTIMRLLLTFEKNKTAGIICPININAERSGLDWLFASDIPAACVSDLYFGNKKESYDVNFCNAASWLISRECIQKVGGFDTNMFVHYGEDNNYCQRVLFHGYRILIDTTCEICHDREFRKGKENQYRNNTFGNNNISRSIEFGNLLVSVDVDSCIKSVRKSIFKSYLKLNFLKVKCYKNDLYFYKKVKLSRSQNSKGNLSWL